MDEDWTWQVAHAARTARDLGEWFELRDAERRGIAVAEAAGFPLLATPHYLSLIDPSDPNDPIRVQCVPTGAEDRAVPLDQEDPLAEEAHTVAPQLVRRYEDRALLLSTDRCATHCRHCTRRRRVGAAGPRSLGELEPALSWLSEHAEVREVLVSGGDPLLAPDRWIEALLGRLRRIPSIELIRVGSRIPVTLPHRITPRLCQVLRRHAPIYLTTHFNHPRELARASRRACARLADAGIPLANQAVLLRGVNDSVAVQAELGRALLRARVRPYYLMQCDSVRGTGHLRVSVGRGVEIVAGLRGRLTGLAIPTYVLDLPGGEGKVTLGPQYLRRREGELLVLESPGGEEVRYYDPVDDRASGGDTVLDR